MKNFFIASLSVLICTGLLTNNVLASTTDNYTEQTLYTIDDTVYYECGHSIQDHISVVEDTNSIEPQSLDCICGGNLNVTVVFTGAWLYNQVSRKCVDGKVNGHDYQQQQQIIKRYSCGKCEDKYELTSYNKRWICKGF